MAKFKDKLLLVFTAVYTPDSLDLIEKKFNDMPVRQHRGQRNKHEWVAYATNPITLASSFFGLPNRCENGVTPSWSNIAKNLFGWQDNKSTARSIFNFLLSPFALAWNLATAAIKTIINIAKLFTEFTPLLLAALCSSLIDYTNKEAEDACTGVLSPGKLFLQRATKCMNVFFNALLFIGRALTSPLNSIRKAWYTGQELAGTGIGGKLLGGSLALLSASITIVAYSFALPLVISATAPAIISKISVSLSQFAGPVMNTLSAALSWIGSQVVMPVLGQAFASLGVSVSPAFAGAVTLGTFAMTTLGTALDRVISPFKEWWNRSAKRVASTPSNNASAPEKNNSNANPQGIRFIPTHTNLQKKLPYSSKTDSSAYTSSHIIRRNRKKPTLTIDYPFETESFAGAKSAFFPTPSPSPELVGHNCTPTKAVDAAHGESESKPMIPGGFVPTNWS